MSNIGQPARQLRIRIGKRETTMDSFVHEKNLELLRRRLAECDATKDWQQHKMLSRLLAEEEAKEKKAL
jgi:hypothetical protein